MLKNFKGVAKKFVESKSDSCVLVGPTGGGKTTALIQKMLNGVKNGDNKFLLGGNKFLLIACNTRWNMFLERVLNFSKEVKMVEKINIEMNAVLEISGIKFYIQGVNSYNKAQGYGHKRILICDNYSFAKMNDVLNMGFDKKYIVAGFDWNGCASLDINTNLCELFVQPDGTSPLAENLENLPKNFCNDVIIADSKNVYSFMNLGRVKEKNND